MPDSAILWTVARQATLSMEFSRHEYWSGLPGPPPGESSQSRDRTQVCYVSCTGRWFLYHWSPLGSPYSLIYSCNFKWTTQFPPFSLGTHFMTMKTHYSGLLVQKSQLADSPNCCSIGSTTALASGEQAWRCAQGTRAPYPGKGRTPPVADCGLTMPHQPGQTAL